MFDSKEIARRALLLAAEIEEQRARRRSKLMVAAVLLCGVCAVAALVVSTLLQPGTGQSVSEITDEPLPLASPDIGPASGVIFPAIEVIVIPFGEDGFEMPLINPASNTCYLTFEIVLTDTGETLFISEPVAPAEHAGNQTLKKELPRGNYSVELIMSACELDSFDELETTRVAADLSVKKENSAY